MANRKVMGIDVDEVLAGFTQAAYKLIETQCGIRIDDSTVDGVTWDIFEQLPPHDRTRMRAECEKPGFCRNLPVLSGAVEAVKELRKMVHVVAVTSPMHSPTWVWERVEWLREHFGFTSKEIVHTAAKHLVRVPIRLDDSPEHVRSWHEADPEGLTMLWGTARTRNVVSLASFRVENWEEVIRRVEAFV